MTARVDSMRGLLNAEHYAPRLYGYADVGRFGLAHGLLAWARCVCWSHDAGAVMLAPRWFRLRIGPYLRGERDKRAYWRLFTARPYAPPATRLRVLTTAEKVSAETALPPPGFRPERSTVVVFRNEVADNEKKLFHHVVGRSHTLRAHLLAMTWPRFQPDAPRRSHVAIHVRLGDFSAPPDRAAIRRGAKNARLPVAWYAEMLVGLRSRTGLQLPARLYSDGADSDLAEILRLPDVERAPRQESVTDLLSISQAKILIASGSGFSLWGAFLGQLPRISFPTQRIVRVLGTGGHDELEPECDVAADIPDRFVSEIYGRFGN